jgi:hypothetical protein
MHVPTVIANPAEQIKKQKAINKLIPSDRLKKDDIGTLQIRRSVYKYWVSDDKIQRIMINDCADITNCGKELSLIVLIMNMLPEVKQYVDTDADYEYLMAKLQSIRD